MIKVNKVLFEVWINGVGDWWDICEVWGIWTDCLDRSEVSGRCNRCRDYSGVGMKLVIGCWDISEEGIIKFSTCGDCCRHLWLKQLSTWIGTSGSRLDWFSSCRQMWLKWTRGSWTHVLMRWARLGIHLRKKWIMINGSKMILKVIKVRTCCWSRRWEEGRR